jgi:hypothetical protein
MHLRGTSGLGALLAALMLGLTLSGGVQAADDSLATLARTKDHDGAVALLA